MTTINDFIKKSCSPPIKKGETESLDEPKGDKFSPHYDKNGIRIETQEEIKNWLEI